MVFGTGGGINETILADKCADMALSMRVWSRFCVQGVFTACETSLGMVRHENGGNGECRLDILVLC